MCLRGQPRPRKPTLPTFRLKFQRSAFPGAVDSYDVLCGRWGRLIRVHVIDEVQKGSECPKKRDCPRNRSSDAQRSCDWLQYICSSSSCHIAQYLGGTRGNFPAFPASGNAAIFRDSRHIRLTGGNANGATQTTRISFLGSWLFLRVRFGNGRGSRWRDRWSRSRN